ncbi:septation ring formation regulator EzrA [Bacillus sp. RG28]|uniref:Septation ring formation regulator EzrA n=1 Tax=Gottfriedia endophytica TaxID=2820819 RepID=A0A940NS55_9BACI|nr:septation ring formation regulator EzrA [Gottfriedia endophytica]MBP0727289.1 septation ring formation regulator EzrA [Gottfriedia endophytica]
MTFSVVIIVICLVIFGMIGALTVRSRMYKNLDNLETWRIQLMNRPVTDELSKLKALNMTGQTEELFERWRTEWDDIITTVLPKVTDAMYEIEEAINKYRYISAKKQIASLEETLQKAENQIDEILKELRELLGSEEQNSVEIESLNQQYLELRKLLLTHRHLYTIAEAMIEKQLDHIKNNFTNVNEATEHGNYLVARDLVKDLHNDIIDLNEKMKVIPDSYIEASTTIPAQITNLFEGYKQMKEEGYALDYAELENEANECSKVCEECVEHIKTLQLEEAISKMDVVKEQIDKIYDFLEKEVEAKYIVEKEIWSAQEEIQKIREANIKTKEETHIVQQSYQLNEQDTETQKYVEKQVNIITKRFELLQIRVAEQDLAFSVIKEELDSLKQQMDSIREAHNMYVEMLKDLRKDELIARDQLIEMKRLMLEVKRLIQISNLPGMPTSSLQQIQQAQEYMQVVYNELEKKPLKMGKVTILLEQASAAVNECYHDTKYLIEQGYFVEKVIQYSNRYRSKYSVVSEALQKSEQFFRQFEYNQALEEAAAALESVEPGAINKLQEILSEQRYTLPL